MINPRNQYIPPTSTLAGESLPIVRDSANRWLDNLYALQGWLKKRFQGMDSQVISLFKEVGRGGCEVLC